MLFARHSHLHGALSGKVQSATHNSNTILYTVQSQCICRGTVWLVWHPCLFLQSLSPSLHWLSPSFGNRNHHIHHVCDPHIQVTILGQTYDIELLQPLRMLFACALPLRRVLPFSE